MPPAAATPNCTDTPRSTVRELGCATMVSGTGGPASPVPEMEQFVVPEVASLATFNVPPKGPPAKGSGKAVTDRSHPGNDLARIIVFALPQYGQILATKVWNEFSATPPRNCEGIRHRFLVAHAARH